jgi:serine phosphatase RsbU (regulator of sigma subunit)
VVGGDIYTLTPLRDKEWLLMVIDCTGHGVPGAFVSMLVKAIERQVIANLSFTQAEVNPADILAQFNVTIKNLLNQHSKDSVSDAGFDGAVIYYHQEKQKLLFSGANTPLFVMRQGELEMIKGNRQGIGYKHSDSHYVYTTHDIQVTPHMRCYVSTDGYLDQNGGEQDFPLGKTRFMNALLASQHLSMAEQEAYLMTTLANYQGNAMRNDDISMVGFSLS